MKKKVVLLGLVLVFALVMGGAYTLYENLAGQGSAAMTEREEAEMGSSHQRDQRHSCRPADPVPHPHAGGFGLLRPLSEQLRNPKLNHKGGAQPGAAFSRLIQLPARSKCSGKPPVPA